MDCSSFVSAIGQLGVSASKASHAFGEMNKALNGYSHAEGYSSLSSRQPTVVLSRSPVRPSTIVKMSVVRKPLMKIDGIKSATLTIDNSKIDWDVLERHFGLNH